MNWQAILAERHGPVGVLNRVVPDEEDLAAAMVMARRDRVARSPLPAESGTQH